MEELLFEPVPEPRLKPVPCRRWPYVYDTWKDKYEECNEKRKKLERFLDRLGIEYKDI